MNDWLVDPLTNRMAGGTADQSTSLPTDKSTDWANWPTDDQPTDQLTDQPAYPPTD